MICGAEKIEVENKTTEQLIQEFGTKFAISIGQTDRNSIFYDYFGIVFLMYNNIAIIYGNTKDFINNVKQGKIKFVKLI